MIYFFLSIVSLQSSCILIVVNQEKETITVKPRAREKIQIFFDLMEGFFGVCFQRRQGWLFPLNVGWIQQRGWIKSAKCRPEHARNVAWEQKAGVSVWEELGRRKTFALSLFPSLSLLASKMLFGSHRCLDETTSHCPGWPWSRWGLRLWKQALIHMTPSFAAPELRRPRQCCRHERSKHLWCSFISGVLCPNKHKFVAQIGRHCTQVMPDPTGALCWDAGAGLCVLYPIRNHQRTTIRAFLHKSEIQ